MIIDCISDLHGFLPELSGGDLLIIAGDLTARDELHQYEKFVQWMQYQKYKTIIWIGGNHDGMIEKRLIRFSSIHNIIYLEDSMTIVNDLKIWGSPWTPTFYNWHFMKDRGTAIKEKWDLITEDIDILITHGPPYGILDKVFMSSKANIGNHAGCVDLREAIERIQPKLHVFGHVHEGYGQMTLKCTPRDIKCVNASIMNENYEPVNKPIRIIL